MRPRRRRPRRDAQGDLSSAATTDGDLRPDAPRKRIVFLDTPGDYPHNGLAGFAFDALGDMYFGCGENLGADYKLDRHRRSTLSGGGEGGNIYRCRPDGTQLEHWATGFWNPHASCVDAFGRLFTVDNDPDSRPPCRLLHIVPGGDYGYRFRNGRKGLHPFTAWNGELPGTLPMVAGTGEAPSGIVAYESDGLPADYRGNLLVTSWGDHRIDRFRLEAQGRVVHVAGASRSSPAARTSARSASPGPRWQPVLHRLGLEDYKLHGQGRIWRISAVEPRKRAVADARSVPEPPQNLRPPRPAGWTPEYNFDNVQATRLSYAKLQESLRTKSLDQLTNVEFRDPFVYRAALLVLARSGPEQIRRAIRRRKDSASADAIADAVGGPAKELAQLAKIVERGLNDPDPIIRQAAVQWVGEEKLAALRPQLEAILNDGGHRRVVRSDLGGAESLEGVKRISSDEFSGAVCPHDRRATTNARPH